MVSEPDNLTRAFAASARLRQAYLVLLFAVLVAGGVTFVVKAFHDVYVPYQWDDDEGAVWWEAAHVTHLREAYHPLQQFPYVVVPYPPVYHLATWLLAQVNGDFLVAGRLICVLSALGIGLVLGLLVFRASPQRLSTCLRVSAGIVTGLLCFRLDALNGYLPEMGVDLLAIFLTFLGLFLFVRSASKPARQYAAFAIFTLALFTKQTMLAAPAACLLLSAFVSPRAAIRRALFAALLGGAGLGYLAWATHGEILRHLFLYNFGQPFSLTHWINGLQENLIGVLPLGALAVLALLPTAFSGINSNRGSWLRWLRRSVQASPTRRALVVLGLELCLALGTSLSYGKLGSGFHYFLEWNFVCCALAALLWVRAMAAWRPASRYTTGGAAVCLLVLLAALTGFPDSLRRVNQVFELTAGERHIEQIKRASAVTVLNILKTTPGPVFCENMMLVMKARKEIPIEPGINCYLAKLGIWDESPFVKMIAAQKFEVIILRNLDNPFWTEAMQSAVREHYTSTEHLGDPAVENSYYVVYRPRLKVVSP
jgi:hypothetical protein